MIVYMYEMFYLITLSKESNSEKFAPVSREFATYIIELQCSLRIGYDI